MLPLMSLLDILPRYDKSCAHGKVGDVKATVKFRYQGVDYIYKNLSQELINKLYVHHVEAYCTSTYGHGNANLIVFCVEGDDYNA